MQFSPLEILKIGEMRRLKQRTNQILDYYYKHYTYFQNERAKILTLLKESLYKNTREFEFQDWHRCITYKYSNCPLSARGSVVSDPGGRFNIGDIDEIKFPKFPALYIAGSYETAYRERFQLAPKDKRDSLSADELALNKSISTSNIAVKGKINTTLDLSDNNSLKKFYTLIGKIKLPNYLEKEAKQLNIPVMYHVKSFKELSESILMENWRGLPMQVDIPSNSQILGQIAHAAKIEAILYPSKMSKKSKCLAIFVDNFQGSPSFVEISDATPSTVEIKKLDLNTYKELG